MASEVFQRLPQLCRPLRYAIELRPCLKTFTFVGKQSVSVDMTESASEIVVNAKNLSVNSAKFNGVSVEVVPKPEVEQVRFLLDSPCQASPAVLDLDFKGHISDKMVGFYRSAYSIENEVQKVMLATHFEPSNARQAFPCWDEPDFKSVFSITLVVPKNMSAISNMPVVSKIEQDGNLVAYMFENTPKMSSYLVAFAVGEFEYVEARDSDNVLVRVYSRPGLVSELGRGELALDTACRSLPFFGDYFGIRYPLPKLDMLAIPDFAGGAMENWGLVTFRERTLLAEKETVSPASRQSIALTVSHELAHMWFGNLVTMHWWTDLWLKEGFATWIEYFCVNHCFPEMDIWSHFTYGEMASALRLDALESSHPIEVEVNNPDEIDEIFDTISYSKGSSLIHMLHAYLGDEAFRAGLCAYLAKHAYGNACTEDLWDALASASGLAVAEIMRPWTRTAGFPVVFVEPLDVHANQLRVRLRQTQYRLPSSCTKSPKESLLWPVPITLTCYSSDGQHRVASKHVFRSREEVLQISIPWSPSSVSDCLVQLNADATGLYHVGYTEDQLYRFARQIKTLNWSASAKFAFINDGFALAKAGFIRISDWLTVLPQLLDGEQSYSIWRCVLVDGLATYVRRLVHEGGLSVPAYHAFLRKLTLPVLCTLGFFHSDKCPTTLSHDARLLRSLLVMTAGAEAGDERVVAEAKRRYDTHRSGQDSDAIPGDLRSAVYMTVVRHGSPDIVNQLIEAYTLVKSPEERSHILSALGGASEVCNDTETGGDPAAAPASSLKRVLQFCVDPKGPVRDQDRIQGLQACASWSAAARLATWEAMKADWGHLAEIYHGQFLLAFLIKSVLSGFATKQHVDDVKAFFNHNPVSCPRALQQVHETMDTNLILLERDRTLIANALDQLTQNGSAIS
ncbi:hypothetical protein P879_00690 [Paragonimus westermani]|uniref:Aminopeptidase n=1 Tax=Paragonimus westermani TaxID=34504 RepID=A0A8T0DQB9_9TREM|nr:hypothetical protein P879_00690 [Paragonimus westermani]